MTEEDPIISWVLNHQWRDITKELPPYEVPDMLLVDISIGHNEFYSRAVLFNEFQSD